MLYLNKYKKIFFINFVLTIVCLPNIIYGADSIIPSSACEGLDCEISDFISIIYHMVNFIIWIGLLFSVIVFMYAGWTYMTSAGDEGKIKKAHAMFLNVVIGLVLSLSAFLIVQTIGNALGIKPEVQKIINTNFR
jgi:hypothetical protein